jgi:hypothetical protein
MKINVLLAFTQQNDDNRYKRMFRYHRAIFETLEDNYNNIHKGLKVKLANLTPVVIATNNAQIFDAVGVGLDVTLN